MGDIWFKKRERRRSRRRRRKTTVAQLGILILRGSRRHYTLIGSTEEKEEKTN